MDIPTISRWLGHSEGGDQAMRVYGHPRQEHNNAMIKRVSFDEVAGDNVVRLTREATAAGSS